MTFKIEQEYFENNITDDDDNFVLADGFYSRTILQDELTLAFDDTDDGKWPLDTFIADEPLIDLIFK